MQGILRDGIATWMPSYISETFGLDNKVAILTGVVLPIFGIAVTNLTSFAYRRLIKNEMLLAGLVFGIAMSASIPLAFANKMSPTAAVILMAILNGATHGVNWIVTCMMPPKYERYGKISFVSGLLNSSAYVGSSISVYGVALFTEKAGWGATLVVWSAVALAGTLLFLALGLRKKEL